MEFDASRRNGALGGRALENCEFHLEERGQEVRESRRPGEFGDIGSEMEDREIWMEKPLSNRS